MGLIQVLFAFLGVFILPAWCDYLSFNSSLFNLKLDDASRTLASLSPKSESTFDFSPFDVLANRSANGNYHVGDVVLRYRKSGTTAWTNIDTSQKRATVASQTGTGNTFSISNLAATISGAQPFNLTRTWAFDAAGEPTLSVTLTNTGTTTLEIGSFGFPIEFNSIFTGRTAQDTQSTCSLIDPNIGLDGGYVQVTPLTGTGPALVVTPLSGTSSKFEGWRFLTENTDTSLGYQSQTFEGFYSWEIFTKAYAQNEWASTTPWNPATSVNVTAGQSITLGLKFSLATSISTIDTAVTNAGVPLARGVPGFIVPNDVVASLYLFHNATVSSITTSPAGALTFTQTSAGVYKVTPASSAWGRVEVFITYSDSKTQAVHYFIPKSAPTALSELGTFLTTAQWFVNSTDPFKRSPSVISYDRSVNAPVTQDPRVWIAGLSDEAGAGSWLAATMKQAAQPNAAEIAKLEQFIHGILWGSIQNADYSVKMSVFFYQPGLVTYNYSPTIDWGNWWSWNQASAFGTGRTYDYVHVSAAYWAMYRAARAYPSLVTVEPWQWYLNQSYQTVNYALGTKNGQATTGYQDDGLMGETVWGELLMDLQRENLTSEATNLQSLMKKRATLWNSEAVPYGSEMAWDSTGEEGVYYWTNYFNLTATATKTINTILGYMPTVSHWAWNGNARRYWDNIYGGKLMRIERQGHHYGSGLNALPLLEHFKSNPTDTHAIRVGFAGNSGPLSNIDSGGFASASFHTWPDTLAWDAYSGDYGPNFVGLVLGSGTYVVQDPDLGLVAYGGSLTTGTNGAVTVQPTDAVRRKVYLAAYGLQFEVDAGNIGSVTYSGNSITLTVTSGLSGVVAAQSAVLWIDRFAGVGTNLNVNVGNGLATVRGGWQVNLSSGSATVSITLT